ncbi:hypothetical protein C8J57DRAFT_1512441 [Mycena rebaudengoi]|nr:hypothetical protein C8J57DRAFT_1512441 [Mycena rebaudengoi]
MDIQQLYPGEHHPNLQTRVRRSISAKGQYGARLEIVLMPALPPSHLQPPTHTLTHATSTPRLDRPHKLTTGSSPGRASNSLVYGYIPRATSTESCGLKLPCPLTHPHPPPCALSPISLVGSTRRQTSSRMRAPQANSLYLAARPPSPTRSIRTLDAPRAFEGARERAAKARYGLLLSSSPPPRLRLPPPPLAPCTVTSTLCKIKIQVSQASLSLKSRFYWNVDQDIGPSLPSDPDPDSSPPRHPLQNSSCQCLVWY